MRKSFVLLLALVVLVSGTACFAQSQLVKEKDQVHYTENILYGDKSVVDGVIVEADINYDYYLYWNTRYQIGDTPKEETEYTFYPMGYIDATGPSPGSLSFVTSGLATLKDTYGDEDVEYYGLENAMKELYDNTAPGTENSVTVYLKDYLEYYSFGMDLSFPDRGGYYDMYIHFSEAHLREDLADWEANGTHKEEAKRVRKYLEALDVFQEFFKIPVLDTEVYTLGMVKDEAGKIIGIAESGNNGGSSTGSIDFPDMPAIEGLDSFGFMVHSIFDDGNVYFTFDPHTDNGNLVDVSHIPGGYGIYNSTYNEKDEIDLTSLKMVYPLDTEMIFENLTLDASGKNLLLFQSDGKQYYLSVINRETMTLVDRFILGSSEVYLDSWSYEDFLVVRAENIMVFELGKDGRYTQELAVDLQSLEATIGTVSENDNLFNWDSCFDWNGDTLIVANNVEYLDENLRTTQTCNFCVAAIDETGIVYYGEYDSTLRTTDINYNWCRLDFIQLSY